MAGHGRFEYSPIRDRTFDLPSKNTIAVCVVPNVEYFHFDVPYPSDSSDYVPNVLMHTWRSYGTRVGIWRIMDILDEHDMRATVALNADVCEYESAVVEAGMEREWEFMGHGVTNSKRLVGLERDDEASIIRESRDRIAEFTGQRPTGWLSPGLMETYDTPDLLFDAGFEYVCDWRNDDQPYPMSVEGGALVVMPCSAEIDDIPMLTRRNYSGPEFARTVKDQFDVLYAESQTAGNAKVLSIEIHPYLTGMPHRSKYLDDVLQYVFDHDGVWKATLGDIADFYRSEYM